MRKNSTMQVDETEITTGRRKNYGYWLIGGLIAFVIAALVLWLDSQPVGTGETRASPDGRYTASVMDYSNSNLLGVWEKNWFEFRVEGPGMSHLLTSTPLPGPYFGSRSSTKIIFWEPDSSAVRFVFPSAEFRFAIPPEAAGQ